MTAAQIPGTFNTSMKIDYADYDGPKGLYIATGTEILPLTSHAGAIAFAGSAVQAGIGDSEHSATAQQLVDAALTDAATAA